MKNKKYYLVFIVMLVLIVVSFSGFWAAKNFLNITIENKSVSQICLHSVELGFFEHLSDYSLGEHERVGFLSLLSASNQLSISYSQGACNKSGESDMRNVSCVLDRKGADSCHIYLSGNGILNCSECYK